MIVYVDTHVLVWLYYGETEKLSLSAQKAIEDHDLVASSMAILEIELLHEIGRIRHSASTLLSSLEKSIDLRICELPFHQVVTQSLKENWTRDPFDRLIVANAKVASAPLISKDERIRKHYRRAVW